MTQAHLNRVCGRQPGFVQSQTAVILCDTGWLSVVISCTGRDGLGSMEGGDSRPGRIYIKQMFELTAFQRPQPECPDQNSLSTLEIP